MSAESNSPSAPTGQGERQRSILEIAAELLDLSPPDRGGRFAALDPEVARAVASLIAAVDAADADGFLDPPSASSSSAGQFSELLPRGAAVGRFLILEPLGAGGMGVVYSAYDPQLERKVALKLLRPDRSAGSTARLLREAQALARLAHPNVVAVFDVGFLGEQIFIAMEFVEGRSLRRWILDERPDWRAVLPVFMEAARGLQAAHDAGLVHRDFKPDNVLIGDDGRVKVADFGLARALGEASVATSQSAEQAGSERANERLLSAPLTRAGAIIGTPGFVAPEVLAGGPADARSDQYSFCVALRRALLAWSAEDAADEVEVAELAKARIRAPRRTLAALERGLANDPARRFSSMAQLSAALGGGWLARLGRWRGLALALITIAFVGLGWVGLVLAARQRAALCSGAAEALSSAWSPQRGPAIQASFIATGLGSAADSATQVRHLLDRYADRWTAMHTEACAATRRRGEQSEALLDLRMACLDERRAELDQLADLFENADAPTVESAIRGASRLSNLDDCRNAPNLLAPTPEPNDEAALFEIRAIRTELARTRALRAAGRLESSLNALRQLNRRQVEHAPTRAQVLSYYGLVALQNGLLEEAREPLAQALVLAVAGNSASAGFDAALSSAWADMQGGGEFSNTGHHLELASAWLKRVGSSPIREIRLYHALGRHADYLDRNAEALEWTDRAIALGEKAEEGTEERAFLPTVLAKKGDLLSLAGRYDAATAYLERALALDLSLLGRDHFELIYDYNSLGANWSQLGEFEKAGREYGQALALAQRVLPADHLLVAETQLYLGDLAWLDGKPREALARAREAERIFASLQGPAGVNVGRAQHLRALAEKDLGQLTKALELARRAHHAMNDGLGPESSATAEAALTEGRILLDLGRIREASKRFELADKTLSAGGMGPQWAALASFYRARGEAELAGEGGPAEATARERADAAAVLFGDNRRWARERREMQAWVSRRQAPQVIGEPVSR